MFRMIPIVRRSFNDAVTTIDYFIAWRFMRRLGQATPEEIRNTYKILVGNPKGRCHLDDFGVDERMKSEWILEK